jgi:hypothetical protein
MANNRMYIRCKKCGEFIGIGSCMLSEYHWSASNEHKHLEDYLNDFFKEHCFCEKKLNKKELEKLETPLGKYENWDNRFEIAYEYEYEWDDDE